VVCMFFFCFCTPSFKVFEVADVISRPLLGFCFLFFVLFLSTAFFFHGFVTLAGSPSRVGGYPAIPPLLFLASGTIGVSPVLVLAPPPTSLRLVSGGFGGLQAASWPRSFIFPRFDGAAWAHSPLCPGPFFYGQKTTKPFLPHDVT